MELVEKIVEMRGIKRNEIIDYFTDIGGKVSENGRIAGDGWYVYISDEKPVSVGSFKIISVKVVLLCEEELISKIYSEFSMKFMRAGG